MTKHNLVGKTIFLQPIDQSWLILYFFNYLRVNYFYGLTFLSSLKIVWPLKYYKNSLTFGVSYKYGMCIYFRARNSDVEIPIMAWIFLIYFMTYVRIYIPHEHQNDIVFMGLICISLPKSCFCNILKLILYMWHCQMWGHKLT